MNISNFLTIVRILLVPFFIYSLFKNNNFSTTLILYFICMVSDALDGLFARILKLKNPIGTYLDPIADKILILSSFFALTYLNKIPMWLLTIIIGKDIIIVTGWLLIYILTGKYTISVTLSGKFTTIFQMITIFLALVDLQNLKWFFYITGVITSISLIEYCIIGTKKITDIYR